MGLSTAINHVLFIIFFFYNKGTARSRVDCFIKLKVANKLAIIGVLNIISLHFLNQYLKTTSKIESEILYLKDNSNHI